MLRVELFTVSPVIPTCSMYLRQFCKLAAKTAGARYIQKKYFQRPNVATAQRIKVQTTTVSANSAQMRWRTRLLRTETEKGGRLAGKQTDHKTIRNSAQKMRPDISSIAECSCGRMARIRSHVPSRDKHDAFDGRRDRG